jgi:hypothetical protein
MAPSFLLVEEAIHGPLRIRAESQSFIVGPSAAPARCRTLLRDLAHSASEHDLRNHLRHSGTPDLTTDALTKVSSGLTSLDEALKMHSI